MPIGRASLSSALGIAGLEEADRDAAGPAGPHAATPATSAAMTAASRTGVRATRARVTVICVALPPFRVFRVHG
jgi:hypothetical protein